MYKEDLALNNLQRLICHKTQANKLIYQISAIIGAIQINIFILIIFTIMLQFRTKNEF